MRCGLSGDRQSHYEGLVRNQGRWFDSTQQHHLAALSTIALTNLVTIPPGLVTILRSRESVASYRG
jgi:hypothetical protein